MFTGFVIRIRRTYTLVFSFLNKAPTNVVVNSNFTDTNSITKKNISLISQNYKWSLLSTMSNSLMRSAINEWWPRNKLGEKSDMCNKVSILFMFIYGFTRREFANFN